MLHIGLSKRHWETDTDLPYKGGGLREECSSVLRWGRGCWKGLRRCRPRRPRPRYQCWLPDSRSSRPWSPPQTHVSWSQWPTAWFYRSSVGMEKMLIKYEPMKGKFYQNNFRVNFLVGRFGIKMKTMQSLPKWVNNLSVFFPFLF